VANIEKLKKAYEEALLEYEKADEVYKRAMALEDEAWNVYFDLKEKHKDKKALMEADEAYNRACEIEAEASREYYKAERKYEKAWKAYSKATAKKD